MSPILILLAIIAAGLIISVYQLSAMYATKQWMREQEKRDDA